MDLCWTGNGNQKTQTFNLRDAGARRLYLCIAPALRAAPRQECVWARLVKNPQQLVKPRSVGHPIRHLARQGRRRVSEWSLIEMAAPTATRGDRPPGDMRKVDQHEPWESKMGRFATRSASHSKKTSPRIRLPRSPGSDGSVATARGARWFPVRRTYLEVGRSATIPRTVLYHLGRLGDPPRTL